MVPEQIGKRIARLRQECGWTQQSLADRLAISRVAVSHIESDISIPGERTIALLAGLFKLAPYELVAGTTYPQAKVDRLPQVVCFYTQMELELELLRNDLAWLQRMEQYSDLAPFQEEVLDKWLQRIRQGRSEHLDDQQQTIMDEVNALFGEMKTIVEARIES